jgi:predicted MFS family arabinose efflux permease
MPSPPRGHRPVLQQEGTAISQEASARAPQAASAPGTGPADGRATFGQVFAVGEFRALWTAQILSVAGDQLARVALTLLVFHRTHSALLAAVTFAASVVPTFLGGIWLSGLADRLPRRQVMIVCDLLRAGLVAVMAIPGTPIAVLVVLLFLVTLIYAPFSSARAALYPDILPGDQYVLSMAVTLTTLQFAQVIGFAAGGVVVGFFGVGTSLLVDAGTFLLSAAITRTFVRVRPAARDRAGTHPETSGGLIPALRLVFSSPQLRTPMLFGWLAAFYNAPEGVAAPLAVSLGGGAVSVGAILAAGALGASLGGVAFSRGVAPHRRERWTAPLAFMSCAVLTLFVFRPPLPLSVVILFASGVFDCYQVAASAAFVSATPPGQRSQAFGIAQGGMSLGQGTAMVVAGAAAQHHSPSLVVTLMGGIGLAAALLIAGSQAGAHRRSHP